MTNITFILHVMWYESKLINEVIHSVRNALNYYPDVDFKLKMCLNSQTYWETPDDGNTKLRFDEFLRNPALNTFKVEIIQKTDQDPFYSIGDWRREQYDGKGMVVWGEADCILPREFFYAIDFANKSIAEKPYFVTLSARKMWDRSWLAVEHPKLRNKTLDEWKKIDETLCCDGYINQERLDEFNSDNEFAIIKLDEHKGDGALVTLNEGFSTPFISPNLHCFGDDSCFMAFCRKKNIPQYHVDGLLKGHNTHIRNKRFGAVNKNDFNKYEELKQAGYAEINRWIQTI